MPFIPGLELSRLLYEEELKPLMERKFPGVRYAAANLGMCSESFGLDDEVSMDHEWGPRVGFYLSESDHARYATDMLAVFRASLPAQFKGFDVIWKKPGVDVQDTRQAIIYRVGVSTVPKLLAFYGGIKTLPLQDLDWLRISEQHLAEITSGAVYRDDLGELTRARDLLRYYPDGVLRFLLMCDWDAVGGDWFPIGRIGSRGDRLGLRIQAAKVAHRLMHIAFRVSRKYTPYKKWFGTLFKALPVAQALEPVLLDLLSEDQWPHVEEKIGEAASILLQEQNALGLTPPIALEAKTVDDGRRHIMLDFGRIGRQTAQGLPPPLKSLPDHEVHWLHEKRLILWNEEVGKWSLLLQQ